MTKVTSIDKDPAGKLMGKTTDVPDHRECVFKSLRLQGLSYAEIDRRLGTSTGVAWKILNLEANRKNNRDSSARNRRRNRVALCDLPIDLDPWKS